MHPNLALLRATPVAAAYKVILKPIFFSQNPEDIHDRMLSVGEKLGTSKIGRALTAASFHYAHPMLGQTIEGIHLPNPVGLAAGFDKDGILSALVGEIGFGSQEIGTVTLSASEGNAKPRLWRIPEAESLVVHFGLRNHGAAALVERLDQLPKVSHKAALGVSVAPTNDPSLQTINALIDDTVSAARLVAPKASWLTVNLSCPNVCHDKPFETPESLDALLTVLAREGGDLPPVFIKLSPDLHRDDASALLAVAAKHGVTGVIFGNLTKDTDALPKGVHIPGPGGYSGLPTRAKSGALLMEMAKEWKREFVYVACGGVMSIDDLYSRIRLGASFVQLVSGLVFKGPQLPGMLNAQLVKRLQRDGFSSVSEAVGVDVWGK